MVNHDNKNNNYRNNLNMNRELFVGPQQNVKPEWIDHNGHMNVAFYLVAFDDSIGSLFRFLGLDRKYRESHKVATYCGDFHIRYVRELHEGDPLTITTQLISCDEKRVHLCQSMFHENEGYLAAQSEVIYLHIDLQTIRVVSMGAELFARIKAMCNAHSVLPKPSNLGRLIGKPVVRNR